MGRSHRSRMMTSLLARWAVRLTQLNSRLNLLPEITKTKRRRKREGAIEEKKDSYRTMLQVLVSSLFSRRVQVGV